MVTLSRPTQVIVPKELGPAMKALTGNQKRFVLAFMSMGMLRGCATDAARAAGYKDGGGLKVTASRLLRDRRVLAAMHEEVALMDAQMGWRAKARLAELVDSEDEDTALKAVRTTLEMTGSMIKRSEMTVRHEIAELPTDELERRIAEAEKRVLAERERLRLNPPIEGEFEEVPLPVDGGESPFDDLPAEANGNSVES